jgi:hypothetical protein
MASEQIETLLHQVLPNETDFRFVQDALLTGVCDTPYYETEITTAFRQFVDV